MTEGLELFASTLLTSFTALIVPILIMIIAGMINFKEKTKKIVLNVLSIIYSWVVGVIEVFVFMLMFTLARANIYLSIILTLLLGALYLIPIYIFVLKRLKMTKWKYILINLVSFVLAIAVVAIAIMFV